MPSDLSVATDPLVVYGMVGLLIGAIVLAVLFSRPRHGLGAVKPSDVVHGAATDESWMPTGDIFGRDPEQPAPLPAAPTLAGPPPAAPTPRAAPVAHDPWSTGATGPTGGPPPWGKR